VKSNKKAVGWWLVGKADRFTSRSHVYVFVDLHGEQRPSYLVVPSAFVAKHTKVSAWPYFHKKSVKPRSKKSEGWELFGKAHAELPIIR
jgi:hypothetical protein